MSVKELSDFLNELIKRGYEDSLIYYDNRKVTIGYAVLDKSISMDLRLYE